MRLVCGESKILSPSHRPGIALFLLALQCSVLMTCVGIRLENVTVPSVGLVGQSISLGCTYLLENDKLYSLKWYKDGAEFYRFSPGQTRPNIVTFPTHGVQVDNQELHNYKVNAVTLRSLSLNSTGVYKCEASSEAPFFQTVSEERKLNVIIPPNPVSPLISKFPATVYMYDYVSGNCTSYSSYPAANLSFYLHDKKWNNVTFYEPVRERDREGREVWTSILGLRVRVDQNMFYKGTIRLKCKASILGKEWETTKNITHHNKNYQPPLYSSARNQFSSASRIRWCFSGRSWTFPLFSISTLCSGLYTLYFYATVHP